MRHLNHLTQSKFERILSVQGRVNWKGRASMLQSTLARGTRLAHNQRLIDRRKLRGKARARAIARVNAKRLGRSVGSRRRATSPRTTRCRMTASGPLTRMKTIPSSITSSSRARPSRIRPALFAALVSRHLPHRRRRRRAGARATPIAHDAHLGLSLAP
jgi:hypothetical protein